MDAAAGLPADTQAKGRSGNDAEAAWAAEPLIADVAESSPHRHAGAERKVGAAAVPGGDVQKKASVSVTGLTVCALLLICTVVAWEASLQPGQGSSGGSSSHPDSHLGWHTPVEGVPEFDWQHRPRLATGRHGAVAADHGRCSEMGLSILRRGGNAADACVTTALCEGVLNPMASGIGGGGFINIMLPNGTAEIIDAREFAPSGATEKMFKDNASAAVMGGLAIAVPLELRGLELLHQRHGSLPWADLFEPVIPFAEHGFPAHPYIVAGLSSNVSLEAMRADPQLREAFLVRDGRLWRPPHVNETCCRRPQLAALLRAAAQHGADVMHEGELAASLAADIQAAGGLVTAGDLKRARPQVKPAMRAHAYGVELIFPPPPSSAAVIVAALHILSGYPLRLTAAGSLGTHRFVEAMKHAFALRMSLGDPGPDPANPFVNITKQDQLLDDTLSRKFADELRADILDDRTQPPENYGGRWNVLQDPPKDHGTCHFSIVGGDGMAVAMTTTINTPYGSKVMSKSTGILLNNEMGDFSTPGQHDVFNLPPAEANFIRPGKKPLSSMSPTIVLQNGRLRAVLGASGGPLIVSSVLQTLVRLLARCDQGIDLIAKPRFHHQLLPDNLFAENWTASGTDLSFPQHELDMLAERGHNITTFPWGACVSAIFADPDDSSLLTGICDPRKDGAPAVY